MEQWAIRNAEIGSNTLESLLREGWEPFAVTHLRWGMQPMVYLRKIPTISERDFVHD